MWLTAPCNGILSNVEIGWASAFGGQPDSLDGTVDVLVVQRRLQLVVAGVELANKDSRITEQIVDLPKPDPDGRTRPAGRMRRDRRLGVARFISGISVGGGKDFEKPNVPLRLARAPKVHCFAHRSRT